ncbi:hypothetical protein OM076_26505 [Solirubrobacter ginsenosidimutans]|uniref:HPr kinase/phosphorylase n=1 Tax=Solirubrobacter ginsenosidimutans TaxID=490573 RepID=A0A9X3MYY0_9ACTN|nr:hypothetical protein [Solirubrobacter ginsenosidimutans]MDA0163850.1 hypothetical protein [Solirubrobacter ginsenosidimutans]
MSTYSLHGVDLEVHGAPDIQLEMELRLRAFRSPVGAHPLRLEFLEGPDRAIAPPTDASRPVYETPYGDVAYFPDTDTLWGDLRGVRLRCDATSGVARLQCDTGFSGRELYLATHPLATIALMELLERRDRYCLHAGCLELDGRGVLVAGPTGSGKSTLTVALVRAGLGFVSDDLVFLAHGEDRLEALGFADAAGVTDASAERFALEGTPRRDGFPKRLIRLEDAFGVTPVERCEPRVIVFPEVVYDSPGEVMPLDPGEAYLRLVPDVLLTQPAGTQAHLKAIAALLAQVRCYTLRSGTDLGYTAELVRALLRTPA